MSSNSIIINFNALRKNIIQSFVEDFIEHFLPDLHKDIDFSVEPEFPEGNVKATFVKGASKDDDIYDKFFIVRLKNGKNYPILVHIAIDYYAPKTCVEEMQCYYYRIYDHCECDVTVLSIFIHRQKYYYNICKKIIEGTKTIFEFSHHIGDIKENADEMKYFSLWANLYIFQAKANYDSLSSFKNEILEDLKSRVYFNIVAVDIIVLIQTSMNLLKHPERYIWRWYIMKGSFFLDFLSDTTRSERNNSDTTTFFDKAVKELIAQKEVIKAAVLQEIEEDVAQYEAILTHKRAKKEAVLGRVSPKDKLLLKVFGKESQDAALQKTKEQILELQMLKIPNTLLLSHTLFF